MPKSIGSLPLITSLTLATLAGCGSDDNAAGPAKAGEAYAPLTVGNTYATAYTDRFTLETSGSAEADGEERSFTSNAQLDAVGTSTSEITGVDETAFSRPVFVERREAEETNEESLQFLMGDESDTQNESYSIDSVSFVYITSDEEGVFVWGTREEGGTIEAYDEPIEDIPAQVKVGDEWTTTYLPDIESREEGANATMTFGLIGVRVEKIETIMVSAGSFQALKIVRTLDNLKFTFEDPEITMQATNPTAQIVDWFAEGVGRVKQTISMSYNVTASADDGSASMSMTGTFDAQRVEELTDSSLASAKAAGSAPVFAGIGLPGTDIIDFASRATEAARGAMGQVLRVEFGR